MKKASSTISMFVLILLFISMPVLAVYSIKHPNKGVVVSKRYYEGGESTFNDGNMVINLVIYPRYRITVINALEVATISVNRDEYNSIKKWRKYTAKHNLRMYY